LRNGLGADRGLDWLVFFVADIQTGFGPFVAVFLTTQKWTQVDIGLLLTVSSLVGLLGQIPAGAIVDAAKSPRAVIALALLAIGASAFAFALMPDFPIAMMSRIVHALASCLLNLGIISVSLGVAGEGGISERLGRNAAFASAGTAAAAAVMGLCGYYLSSQAVFFVAGGMVIFALASLRLITPKEIGPATEVARGAPADIGASATGLIALLRNKSFLSLALCLVCFHLANAAMLPIAASMVTLRSSQAATLMVAAAVLVPQIVTTLVSPWVGRKAHVWGRRPLLLLGYAALAIRGVLFTATLDPSSIVAIQALDGLSAAVLAVVPPLVIVDLTRESGHFNLAQGAAGSAAGVGAAASTMLAGFISDRFDVHVAFVSLTALAFAALCAVALLLPETETQEQKTQVPKRRGR
jgi:MFS family permease